MLERVYTDSEGQPASGPDGLLQGGKYLLCQSTPFQSHITM